MKVVYCANRQIYHLLPTTLNSLLQNNPKIEKIYLLIEDDDIPYIRHPKITFINTNQFDFLIRNGFNCPRQFTYMAMTRCFLTKILNEDKILYLDVDTIVDQNLEELWNFNIGGNYLAAHYESHKTNYFNSGVLLINLKLIRSTHYDDRLINLLKKCRFVFPDQDAMNIIFQNHIAALPHKFNCIGGDEIYKEEIAIRHYAGLIKPWREGATEKDKEFWNKYKTNEIKEE